MAVESATTINQLDQTKPGINDLKSEGDDHIRMLKSTIKNTLPNLTGPVTATQAELNRVVGVTSPLQAQIDTKANIASPDFTGNPTAPTATAGTSTNQIATTAFVAATAFAPVLPGQSGNAGRYLTTNGSNASWGVPSIQHYQEFLTSGTWTKPANANFVYVEAIGGGGGGGLYSANGTGGGGGGFSASLFLAIDVPATVAVTVGAGGAGASGALGSGGIGGTSFFGALLQSLGGNATAQGSAGGGEVAGSSSALASGGFSSGGGSFGNGLRGGNCVKGGAGGGGSYNAAGPAPLGGLSTEGGNGGAGSSNNSFPGQNGFAPGGGGGSRYSASGSSTAGAGGAGRVRVWAW